MLAKIICGGMIKFINSFHVPYLLFLFLFDPVIYTEKGVYNVY